MGDDYVNFFRRVRTLAEKYIALAKDRPNQTDSARHFYELVNELSVAMWVTTGRPITGYLSPVIAPKIRAVLETHFAREEVEIVFEIVEHADQVVIVAKGPGLINDPIIGEITKVADALVTMASL